MPRARHEEISDHLRSCIMSGNLATGAQLPSENDLCEQFEVSRVTVRRALQTLDQENLIDRRQGVGSFVRAPQMTQGLVRLTDFSQDMARAGLEAVSRTLFMGIENAPISVMEALQLTQDKKVYRLDRLRLGGGEVIAFDRTYLPIFYGQLLQDQDFTYATIFEILESQYGIRILNGSSRILAAVADARLAELMEVSEGSPLLKVVRMSKTIGAKVVYIQYRYYRADRVAFELELQRIPENQRHPDSNPASMVLQEFEPILITPGQDPI